MQPGFPVTSVSQPLFLIISIFRARTSFDSRGFANLKLGQLEQAIADYDAALRLNPKNPGSLFGRGMAKVARGDGSGNDDIGVAKTLKPNIAEVFARAGLKEIFAKEEPRPAPVAAPAAPPAPPAAAPGPAVTPPAAAPIAEPEAAPGPAEKAN